MSRNKDVREAAAETTHAAAERGQAILDQAIEALAPLLSQAQDVAKDRVAPAAGAAKDRLTPVADAAKQRVAPLADSAKSKMAPLAATAAMGGADLAHKTKGQIQPHLVSLAEKAQPTMDGARAKVNDELVPQLVELLHQAENHPAISEANKRSHAAAAALRGDLELPQKKQRSVGGTIAKVAAVSAVMGAVAVAVRQFLAQKDDAWTAHQPSAAYVNGGDDLVEDSAPRSDDAAEAVLDEAETESDVDAPSAKADVDTEADPHEQMSAEGGPVAGAETTNEDIAVLNEYGEGSYVGEEPPSDYTIKGNERSMKFHTGDSAGYERTIADVWFNSAEAAEKAGFTRAQR